MANFIWLFLNVIQSKKLKDYKVAPTGAQRYHEQVHRAYQQALSDINVLHGLSIHKYLTKLVHVQSSAIHNRMRRRPPHPPTLE